MYKGLKDGALALCLLGLLPNIATAASADLEAKFLEQLAANAELVAAARPVLINELNQCVHSDGERVWVVNEDERCGTTDESRWIWRASTTQRLVQLRHESSDKCLHWMVPLNFPIFVECAENMDQTNSWHYEEVIRDRAWRLRPSPGSPRALTARSVAQGLVLSPVTDPMDNAQLWSGGW